MQLTSMGEEDVQLATNRAGERRDDVVDAEGACGRTTAAALIYA